MSKREKFNDSLNAFGIETGNNRPAGQQNGAGVMKKENTHQADPQEIAKRNEFMKGSFDTAMKPKRDINHDEDQLMREAWRKEYKNCLVLIEKHMRKKKETIAQMRQDVIDKKSTLPRNTRDFLANTNPRYIEGWLSRMYQDYFELADEVKATATQEG